MNPMIMRVAKAICCPAGTCENDGRAYDPIKGSVSICQAGSFEREARGAIAAMRDPTDSMIEASNREWDGRMSHRSSGAWQAMIDEALK